MGDDKRTAEDRRYAVLPKESVRMYAESVGHSDISDEVAALLAEDVTYRLREMIQHSCHFLRHSRRKKLNTEDVNKALRHSDIPPVFGHGMQEVLPFRQTKEGDLFFVEELDINLHSMACSTPTVPQISEACLKAQWLAVEGVQKAGTFPQGMHAKLSTKSQSTVISDDLLQYYDSVTKAILANDEEIMKLALIDLRTNTKLSPLMPYFVNFISNGVRTVSHDITQLTKLLHTVRALISNQSLNLEPKPFLELLVQGVLYCVIEPLAASINPLNDHWKLRDYAARLLAQIVRDWENPLNNLREKNINALQEVLYDLARPFCSHYGAVMGLFAFGTQAVEDVLLPHLPSFLPHLQSTMDDLSYTNALVKADAHKVHGAILLAGEYVLKARVAKVLALPRDSIETLPPPPAPSQRQDPPSLDKESQETSTIKPDPESSADPAAANQNSVQVTDTSDLIGSILQLPETTNPYRVLAEMYRELYKYFGDSLCIKCPVRHVSGVYVIRKQEPQVTLGGVTSGEMKQSGEEMLKQFLGAVAEDMEDGRSENHSLEPTPEDMEYDIEEKSSRSSRSDRSHSDENLSFMGEDADLTVKATVSDPSQGIKLTILKRPKTKVTEFSDEEEEEMEDIKPIVIPKEEPMPVLERKSPPRLLPKPFKSSCRLNLEEVFEVEPMIQNEVYFVFRFQGCEQVCEFKKNSKRMQPSPYPLPKSEYKQLIGMLRPYGKRKFQTSAKRKCKRAPSWFLSGNMDNIL